MQRTLTEVLCLRWRGFPYLALFTLGVEFLLSPVRQQTDFCCPQARCSLLRYGRNRVQLACAYSRSASYYGNWRIVC
ncbi:hypothetical protein XELAEV_18014904mg [Xenopus laevis]|uniref:Uncharacterized protein n=1 Tax=Xenopus laevis TaxID=8355 RepID=A0A974HVF9_XENLA|nr:hypothetical protein XELAEV_18014904mg [Xenopus laevis]